MRIFYIILLLVFTGLSSNTYAQQQDTLVQDTVLYNADSNVEYQQYPVAYWINDSVFVNTTDSIAILDSAISPQSGDSTILNVDSNATAANAVAANGRTYTQVFDSLASGLIPNRIPYGVLYDQSPEWTNLLYPIDTIKNVYFLYQSWHDMENSRIAPQDNGMYAQMRQMVSSEARNLRYPLISIHYNFAYIDSEAISDGRLSIVNGIMTDSGGTSPYNVVQANITGIPINSVSQYDTITIEYIPGLYLTNTPDTITSISISDALENTSYTFSAYGSYPLSFSVLGTHTLVIESRYSSGAVTTRYEGVDAFARAVVDAVCPPTSSLVYSNIPFQGYSESVATNSIADYHIFYHRDAFGGCTNTLAKPIIITDGIDAGDNRSFLGIYNLLNYIDGSGVSQSLGEQLRNLGYDVIVLNFPVLGDSIVTSSGTFRVPSIVTDTRGMPIDDAGRDGGNDYIERNAFLTVRLIQIVDSTLAAEGRSDSIVIVGPSMGGLVTRYALAFMEKQDAGGVANMKHRCRLWVSFDSPHLGANVPAAVQQSLYWFGTTGEEDDAWDKFDANFNAPAAQQLLIEQFLYGYNNASFFRTTFLYNLTHNGLTGSLGWPKNLRKISLVNGSANGTPNFSPGAEFLSGSSDWFFLATFIHYSQLDAYFMPPYGVSENLSTSGRTVFRASSLYYWYLHSGYPNVTNYNSHGSMDNVPGSILFTPDTIQAAFTAGGIAAGHPIGWAHTLDYHTFIPTISALAFNNPDFDWNTPINNRNLMCTNETPFDNYYVQNTNQPHITLTNDNVNWLLQELLKGEPNCPMPCPDTWPNYLCDYSTYSLPFDDLPLGATVTWSTVDASLRINTATGNPGSITAERSGVYSGDTATTVIATVTNPCGADYVFKKKFLVDIDGILITGPNYSCGPGANEYFVSEIPPDAVCRIGYSDDLHGINYWGATTGGHGDGVSLYGSVGGGIWFGGGSSTVRNFTLNVSCTVPCGTVGGSKDVIFVSRDYCIDHGLRNSNPGDTTNNNQQEIGELTVAPNPSNTSWIFSWPINSNAPVAIVVMDMNGSKVFGDHISGIATDYSMTSENMVSGIYIAKLQYADGTQKTVKLVKL